MKLSKNALKGIAKAVLGLALVVYVLKSRMVDFSGLGKLLFDPVNFLIAMFFLTFSMVCSALRWYLLVRAQDLSLSLRNMVSLTMIGNFFNMFMPGSVGGDLIKAWYVAGRTPNQKTKAIFTVVLDRVVGLAVIIFYAATAMLFFVQWLDSHHELKVIAHFIWFFSAASILLGALFYVPSVWRRPLFVRLVGYLRRFAVLEKLIDSTLLYRDHFMTVVLALVLSALSIFGINIFYYLQGNALGIPMSLTQYFFVAPMVMVASAIPLLPGGIGTGQVAFYTLFQWMEMPNPDLGGTLCTVVQIYYILFNSLGAIFYFRFKRQTNLAAASPGGSPAYGQ